MDESIGGSLLLNIVVVLVGMLIAVFTASFAYSKAFKAKNIILDSINSQNGKLTSAASEGELLNDDDYIIQEIDRQLSNMGYKTSEVQCHNRHNGILVYPSESNLSTDRKNKGYCIYKINQTNSMGSESYFYEVETYMHFDIPLFNFSLPVYGQTKTFQPSPKNIVDIEEDSSIEGLED